MAGAERCDHSGGTSSGVCVNSCTSECPGRPGSADVSDGLTFLFRSGQTHSLPPPPITLPHAPQGTACALAVGCARDASARSIWAASDGGAAAVGPCRSEGDWPLHPSLRPPVCQRAKRHSINKAQRADEASIKMKARPHSMGVDSASTEGLERGARSPRPCSGADGGSSGQTFQS